MAAVVDAEADGALLRLLVDPATRPDPYPLYALLRERAPVLDSSLGQLVVSRYEDATAALRDPRLGRALVGPHRDLRGRPGADPVGAAGLDADPELRRAYFDMAGHNMLLTDPPDHTRLRRLVSRAFTPRRVEALRPAVEAMVDDLLDGLLGAGEVDLMSTFALPLPNAVIGELVGVPDADRAGMVDLVRASAAGIEPIIDDATARAALDATEELGTYFTELLAERRARAADDLLSGLASAAEADDRLTDEEITSTAILLFAAGFETTTNLIGNGTLALLRHPDAMAQLRGDPGLAASGVEELLRWDSPVQFNTRTALEPAVVAGVPVEPGRSVIVLQGAANRDPRRFPDPDVLDLARADNVPLSFGWGAHHCIGAPLARMEGELVLRALATRTSSITLEEDDPPWKPGLTLHGLERLPVSLLPR